MLDRGGGAALQAGGVVLVGYVFIVLAGGRSTGCSVRGTVLIHWLLGVSVFSRGF